MCVGISLGEGILVRSGGILRKKNGFTLLELIVTIVITSILLATVILRYIDLRQNASDGIAKGVLGALRSQNTLIYAQRVLGGTTGIYTMRYVALSMLRAPTTMGYGFSWTAAATRFTMTVGGVSYRFTLTPYPNAPTTLSRITAGTGIYATW
jgi:prepilin-type N-terminal cleavage/methylation domain-containing protein